VDNKTAGIIQDIVDTEFRSCTVLAIMHKLEYVSHYDVVALLGGGKLLEIGEPTSLITGRTQFSELYKTNGMQ
jgi:ATP-binding cassette, subfamily C (CFTR/MRP), member 1